MKHQIKCLKKIRLKKTVNAINKFSRANVSELEIGKSIIF